MNILFNNIEKSANYLRYMETLYSDYSLFRKKHFSQLCLEILNPIFPNANLFLTHSATGALEAIALLLDIQPGDEIILPSFTFISSANAFVAHGAIPVFVDIEKETLNLDLDQVESAITPKTKAVIAVHYAGHACDLNRLRSICDRHNIFLIEDAAMAFGNTFDGKPLGSIGDFGVISFDITKQISAIQGGMLLVNHPDFTQRANYIYHIGTNRSDFLEGNAPYYEWVDVGSKFQMNELNAVALYDQLTSYDSILAHRKLLSEHYHKGFQSLVATGKIRTIHPTQLGQNYHEFYVILKDETEREQLTAHLAEQGIEAMFHYIPLHNSKKGVQYHANALPNSVEISGCLLRLPLHVNMLMEEVNYVVNAIKKYFNV